MVDLNDLRLFSQVVEANSFSKAAKLLKLPVSTISRRVAELESQLGVRLLIRTTRTVRLTEIGAEIFEHACRSADISDAVASIVSHHQIDVFGVLRISAPPSISNTFLAPIIYSFQKKYPKVRIQVFITERDVDHVTEGFDIGFRVGELKDSALIARSILRYRHQMVASPKYLKEHTAPGHPSDLTNHKLIGFSRWTQEQSWELREVNSPGKETVTFKPYLSMNDYAGLTLSLLEGAGIGELPPIVQPELMQDGHLVEIMPNWQLPLFDLYLMHLNHKHLPRLTHLFKEHALLIGANLFPNLAVCKER